MQIDGSARPESGWSVAPAAAAGSQQQQQQQQQQQRRNWSRGAALFRDSASGLVGGLACVVAGHPLDTTKVWLQTSRPGRFAGGLGAFTWLLRAKGVRRGLYAGAVPALAANAAENAALFLLYGEVRPSGHTLSHFDNSFFWDFPDNGSYTVQINSLHLATSS